MLAERIASALAERIVTGELRAGTSLRQAVSQRNSNQAMCRSEKRFNSYERGGWQAGDNAQTIIGWERANRIFHSELIGPCKMPRLLEMLDELQLANSRIIFSTTRSAGWRPTSSHDHRQIVDALRKRDFSKAVILLQRHIRGLSVQQSKRAEDSLRQPAFRLGLPRSRSANYKRNSPHQPIQERP